MPITPDEKRPRLRPGEHITQLLWLRALASGGSLPVPTIERIRALKTLVATWRAEPDE